MTDSRLTQLLAALATTFCLAAPASAAQHEIVMKDGSRIPATSRPVIALGRVSFHDVRGRSSSLSAAVVDLTTTREGMRRNGAVQTQTVWTASDLESARERVQLQTARAVGSQEQLPAEPTRKGSAVRSSTKAEMQVIQDALDRVRAQRRLVRGSDDEASILEERKLALQSELLRLQTTLEIEAERTAKKD